jgi:ankyrin repeat protein
MGRPTTRLAVLCSIWVLSNAAIAAAPNDLRLVEAVRNRDAVRAQTLLAERADPNVRQPDGATALHWAAQWDDVATVDLLIRAGAEINATNDYGVTPLAVACQNGSSTSATVVEKLLKAGANPNAALPSGETVLMTASFAGNADAVKALLAGGANVNAAETAKGQTALMWAVSEGHRDVVRALVDYGADVNARSTGQFTPLLFAARGGDIELARLLLAAGADIDAKGTDGSTPLLIATFRGHVNLAKALLDAGADPNADGPGYTALHWAAGKAESHATVPYAPSDSEWAAQIGIPAEKGQLDFIKALLAHGANPNARSTNKARAADPTRAPYSRADPFSDNQATPFWFAARAADVAAMRLLAAHGADPLLTTEDGTTPLIAAAGQATLFEKVLGSDTLVLERNRVEASRLALQLGANINQANAQGNTALHAAAFSGFATVAEFLIAQSAQLNLRNDVGDTPLKIAQGYHATMNVITSPAVAEVMRKAGGVARPGPPAPYERLSVESNLALRTLLEERAVLVSQLEAFELRKAAGTLASVSEDELGKLQAALASKDEAIEKLADASFYFYQEKPEGR